VEELLIFVGMALVTYFTRATMLVALGGQMPPLLQRWLRYVPPAVLAALIGPATLVPGGHLEIGLPVWAVLAGAVVAWRTRSVLWTIVAGMAAFWLLRVLGL
jgi:branched-subunit amino acid transport protein